jgi:hypothetical protein
MALNVELEARNGNMQEALCAFEDLRLRHPESTRLDSPSAKTAAVIEAALKTETPIAIDARLTRLNRHSAHPEHCGCEI